MKIAFIGGFKDGETKTMQMPGDTPLVMLWTLLEQNTKSANTLTDMLNKPKNTENISNDTFVNYKLKLLKHNNESKFFYVEPNMEKEEIIQKAKQYWLLSDVIGYDLE